MKQVTAEMLAAAAHHAMCDVSHHDAHTVCKNQRKYELIADAMWRSLPDQPDALREALATLRHWRFKDPGQNEYRDWYNLALDDAISLLEALTSAAAGEGGEG